ncbi:hypothetical protein [Actinomadura roseirufa]|uniref:hypothetical protein n=1 Tax=Actinomadura roseirufa TaxID=2094049 RepID=UPI00104110D5|nr:hypothetical protein [Actinomadura roseirufa]
METTSSAGQSPVRPVNRYGPLDTPPIDAEEARRGLGAGRVAILDVQPAERLMSDRPFRLRVAFVSDTPDEGVLSVLVFWDGTPFVVEKRIAAADHDRGHADVEFGAEQSLPPGPATFAVGLITESGSQADFTVSVAVLPSNPFDLRLSPRDNFVTGTFSARAVRSGNAYQTNLTVTLSNGDASAVPMRQEFKWEFWDGPIGGGTLVEQGNGRFPDPITVPAHGTWDGWIAFNSPAGTGIFGKLDAKEDLAVQITMTRQDGGTAAGQITVRTMFSFGLNITRVGAESFTAEEYTDLYLAVDRTRVIYERRDVTLAVDRRFISNAQAGGFTVITSESEARDLFEQWSGPDNGFIDVFVVPSISGTGFDGLAGAIPGPTSHNGRESGVVVDRSGYTSGGVRHLNVPYLGMLIGHEVGHYLGLVHVTEPGNLMLSSSTANDTNLNYDPQYRTLIRHGWVRIA